MSKIIFLLGLNIRILIMKTHLQIGRERTIDKNIKVATQRRSGGEKMALVKDLY